MLPELGPFHFKFTLWGKTGPGEQRKKREWKARREKWHMIHNKENKGMLLEAENTSLIGRGLENF